MAARLSTPPERHLRIAIDGPAFEAAAAGVRRYTWELASALVVGEPSVDVVAIGLDRPGLVPSGVRIRPRSVTLPTNLGWSLVGVHAAARGERFDVFHAPAYTAPLFGLRPRVVTVHDVSYARAPADYPYRSDPLRRWFYRASAAGADVVITDSDFSRREIVAAYGVAPERIAVIPLGVGRPFRPGRPDECDPAPPGLGSTPFVLHVGDLHTRRRLDVILDAVLRVRATQAALRDLRLVLAGKDLGVGAILRGRALEAGAPEALVLAGVVPEAALVTLLRRAATLAYASRYEGFGLPLLEAMACGCPVIALRAASVEEVVGDAALLLATDASPADLAEALAHVCLGGPAASHLRADGLARAARFTWGRTAAATRAVYERVQRAAAKPLVL